MLADALMTRGDIAEAARLYETALEVNPYHPYARACLCAARYELTGDAAYWTMLNALAKTNHHPRVDAMLRRAVPFFGLGLRYPQEAVINTVQKGLPELLRLKASGELPKGGGIAFASNIIESPSAIFGFFGELLRHDIRF